jgi:hypothetical protein
MSTEPIVPASVSPPKPAPVRAVRVEYVAFEDVAEHREFRFRVHEIEGAIERRVRVAVAAFAGRVRLQDGPDVCYQKLLQTLAQADVTSLETITVDEADLARYAEAHTKAPKHRSWSSTSPATPVAPREHVGTPAPARRADPVVAVPAPQGGQRVRHAVYGLGVMSAPTGVHTVIHFDEDGPKRFVTAILAVDVLSTPHTWETGPRGKNRPCS